MSNCYGEPTNPLYPSYENKDEELAELLRFFQFSYEPSSGYTGTAVFEIIDDDETLFLSITCDPNHGVTTSRDVPPSKRSNDDNGNQTSTPCANSFYCTLPYETFHNALWGVAHPRTLVMGGGCSIKNWKYRQAYNFATSFDLSSPKWVEYYNSPNSIRKMINGSNTATQRIIEGIGNITSAIDTRSHMPSSWTTLGHTLPTSANDAEFMYEWRPPVPLSGEDAELWKLQLSLRNLEFGGLRSQALTMMRSVPSSLVDISTMHMRQLWHRAKDEFCGHHPEYKRFNISSVSSSLFGNQSVAEKLSTFVRDNIDKNELMHWHLLSTMF